MLLLICTLSINVSNILHWWINMCALSDMIRKTQGHWGEAKRPRAAKRKLRSETKKNIIKNIAF